MRASRVGVLLSVAFCLASLGILRATAEDGDEAKAVADVEAGVQAKAEADAQAEAEAENDGSETGPRLALSLRPALRAV